MGEVAATGRGLAPPCTTSSAGTSVEHVGLSIGRRLMETGSPPSVLAGRGPADGDPGAW